MDAIDAIEIINDVTWKDFGRHPDFPEARDMAISALKKQIAKKPICLKYTSQVSATAVQLTTVFECCNCHKPVMRQVSYCSECGTRLDWSEI